jgi:hypothetical protein
VDNDPFVCKDARFTRLAGCKSVNLDSTSEAISAVWASRVSMSFAIVFLRRHGDAGAVHEDDLPVPACFSRKADSHHFWFIVPEASVMLPLLT